MKRQDYITKFDSYTSGYDMTDPKIKLKAEHTYRVAELSDTIARDIQNRYGLTDKDIDLAWSIGMLHDIGRFEQVRRYHTFFDADSVDHAEFGADLLFVEKEVAFDIEEPEIVELAIRNHNKYRISEGLSDRENLFCNIIRDADKIDIIKVNSQFSMFDIHGVTDEEVAESDISAEVLDAVLEGNAVKRSIRRTPLDIIVSHVSMMQELVFPVSRRLVKEQGCLRKLLDVQVSNENVKYKLDLVKNQVSDML